MQKSLIGEKFGYWKVLSMSDDQTSKGTYKWSCRCKCGVIKSIDSSV